jgi:glutamine amidotransferase
MTVAVVDSGVANLASVKAALARLDVEAEVTSDAKRIREADYIILPGVGSAVAAMTQLEAKRLVDVLRNLTRPVLGICLGMQLLFTRSEEGRGVSCLDIIPGDVRRLQAKPDMPVPHMGWNQIRPQKSGHPLLQDVPDNSFVYFVHSYAVLAGEYTLASCAYGQSFTAIAQHKNFFGCQFHPERSGVVGGQILKNFLGM